MKVNLAVCGLFHFFNYARFLQSRDVLNRFYYAHRISTRSEVLGIPEDRLVNVWFKEYLFHLHLRLPGVSDGRRIYPFYQSIWESVVLRNWSCSNLLHLLLHGGDGRLIRRAKTEGAIVLGEPVNAHPVVQNNILNEERDRLKLRGSYTLNTMQRKLLEEVEASDRLLVASDFIKRTFVQKGYAAEKIHVLPYGVDLSRFSPADGRGKDKSTFRVVCVSSISIRKGICDLLEAWRRFSFPDGELLLIGAVSPEMRQTLRQYEGLYTYIPHVPNNQLKHYLVDSSVFVLPSLEDGFGLVCTEAMACGLPVVTTSNTGASEIITDGVDGFIVPIRSPDVILEKLELLYADRQLANAMGKNARKKVLSLHGWSGYTEKLVDIYSSMTTKL